LARFILWNPDHPITVYVRCMKLGHVELFCKNCETTRDFYVTHLGFEETEVQGGKYIWLRSEESDILLRPGRFKSRAKDYSESEAALVVYCTDLLSFTDNLTSAGIELGVPDGSPDCITFRDPDGRWLQAVENY
jgi:catechol 2,3-dioxygenase-like lactoylglutathione lyase family enzyme